MFRIRLLPFALIAGAVWMAAAGRAEALTTQRVASGLNRPIFVTAPAGDNRLFILEQTGYIMILKNGVVLPTPFLDIHTLIPNISGNDERGLLGLAFHPQYATNGLFYIDYANTSSNTVIARYQVSANPDIAETGSAQTILAIEQPFTNHKGGTLLFGPNDGYLYIGMGDGGSGGDPGNRAQNPGVLLGKILRIDVDHGSPYSVPSDNPFVGQPGYLGEIWDLGVRNPYRWSFDRETGDMVIADVGQDSWEEIDFEAAHGSGGFNYGWRRMEGTHCYNPPTDCNDGTLTLPIYEYAHGGNPSRCSITGGYVYRGAIPWLRGTYFFADWCSSQIWSFRYVGSTITEFTDRTAELAPGGGQSITNIAGFGEDGGGESYIVDRGSGSNGEVYKIVLNVSGTGGPNDAPRIALTSASPNPFVGTTRIRLTLGRSGPVRVNVVDASGRLVRNLLDGSVPAGSSAIDWDGRDDGGRCVASGAYFIRVTSADGRAETRRAQLIR